MDINYLAYMRKKDNYTRKGKIDNKQIDKLIYF